MSPTDLQWERLAVRLLYKTCPVKGTHSHETGEWNAGAEYCPKCGISRADYLRFILGDEGKMPPRAEASST